MSLRRATAGAILGVMITVGPVADAAERGVIEGVVLNETTGRRGAGVEVTLTGARGDGSGRIEESVAADERGRYRFDNLATGDDRFYVIDARHEGGLFPGSPVTLPSDTDEIPVIETSIKVWDTTNDPDTILLARDDLFVTAGDGALDVIESVTVANMTERAYIGRGERDAPTLGLSLPAAARRGGVEILDSDLDVPELVATDFGVGLTVAIPPGEWRITYAYRVPGAAGAHDLSRTALYPVVRASVHATDGIDVDSNRLVPAGEVTIGGTEYARWSATEAVVDGDQIQIAATVVGNAGPVGLVVAASLAGLALVGTGAWLVARRRRAHPAAARPMPRDDLLAAIAALDVRHDAGDLDDDEWATRRAELKARLVGTEAERIG